MPLLILKDDQGLLPGGAMHAMPSHITTQRAASSLRWEKLLKLPPLKKRSRTYWTLRFTLGLSLG